MARLAAGRRVFQLPFNRKLLLVLPVAAVAALIVLVFFKAAAFPETRLLPYYALRSVLRLAITYVICLAIGMPVGILAGSKESVGKVLIPILDILQSIPVLGFFPLALAVIIRASHGSTLGLELTSMFLLFTSMEWSIVFGVIAGIKAMPMQTRDMSRVFHIKGWEYLRHILLPSIYPYVLAGSILAWGSGWYFVILTEFITFGDQVYQLPGLGYYINTASFRYGSVWMALAGLIVIGAIVFTMNRLIWRRLSEQAKEHRFLALHGFRPHDYERERFWARQAKYLTTALGGIPRPHVPGWLLQLRLRIGSGSRLFAALGTLAMLAALFYGWLRISVSPLDAGHIAIAAAFSLGRLGIAYVVALMIAATVGFLILRLPSLKRSIITVADIMQSIPALAYFPLVFLVFTRVFPERVGLEMAAILLILTGMLWYLMFNVIESVEHWPKELNELSGLLSIRGFRYVRHFLLPALLPALVAGSILAWGGGWNATIVSEYVNIGQQVHMLPGLGSSLDVASNNGDTHQLLILLVVMTGIVVVMNHFLWRRLLSKASNHVFEEN